LPLFVSNELSHYAAVLAEEFSHTEPVPRTGKRGRPANPKKVIDEDLTDAAVKKTRQKGTVVKVERQVIFGTSAKIQCYLNKSPSNTINTSYIERSSLSLRLWDAHLVCNSLKFAKLVELLIAKLSINILWYNFCVITGH
jgi:hypothetical protein